MHMSMGRIGPKETPMTVLKPFETIIDTISFRRYSFTHPWLHNPSKPFRLSFSLPSDRESFPLSFLLLLVPFVSPIPPLMSLPTSFLVLPPLHRSRCVSISVNFRILRLNFNYDTVLLELILVSRNWILDCILCRLQLVILKI